MDNTSPETAPVLAVFPSTIGFGYTLHQNSFTLLDWGVKRASVDKNKICLRRFITLLNFYRPSTVILEDLSPEAREHHPLKADLIAAMACVAVTQDIRVQLYSREQIREAFAPLGATTKQQIAERTGDCLSKLSGLVPAPRKLGEREANAMSYFCAASLALTHFSTIKRKNHKSA